MSEQRTKDPMTTFRTIVRGFNSKKNDLNPQGGERIQLYLDPEEAAQLASTLAEQAHVTDKGVKLDIHISKRENTFTKRPFEGGIMFVKAVQESQMGGGARQAPTQYADRKPADGIAARVEASKKTLNKTVV